MAVGSHEQVSLPGGLQVVSPVHKSPWQVSMVMVAVTIAAMVMRIRVVVMVSGLIAIPIVITDALHAAQYLTHQCSYSTCLLL